ncbi:hypothetical protein HMPREF3230_01176 [Gardnerella vaginalis]|uniref:Orotate phosphoribosyltransferase n=1 Tax=Gardnerella vaginalis TaxID=2702 RepID=A0A135Z3I2_GARVA|nr:hypothetical protein [Gardnerella vaginalis]KXI16205.1 hypothetical protein HMPREF3230_01176 [Gardnerella vaginalis]
MLELQEERSELKRMLCADMSAKPFSELFSVTFAQHASKLVGDVLFDAIERAGYSLDKDVDSVGALTAAAVPMVFALIHAAERKGIELDGFVMDFVFPSTKGPSIKGKRVLLLDSWLSEKSYVQTSSLVTLRHGNELSLDFSIVKQQGAQILAIVALIGGVDADNQGNRHLQLLNPISEENTKMAFVQAFDEEELRENAAHEDCCNDNCCGGHCEVKCTGDCEHDGCTEHCCKDNCCGGHCKAGCTGDCATDGCQE